MCSQAGLVPDCWAIPNGNSANSQPGLLNTPHGVDLADPDL